MSTALPRPLVLAMADPGLRSVLAAQLGMAGEMPISTVDHLDPALGKDIREAAILIIEQSLIGSTPLDWAETLRNQCWSGRIIIIVDQFPQSPYDDASLALVGRRDAGVAILSLVRMWQSQERAALIPPE